MTTVTGCFMRRNRRNPSYDRSREAFSRLLSENPVRIPFSPLIKANDKKSSGDAESYGLKKQRGVNFSRRRQIFVRSYHFTRNRTIAEKFRVSIRRAKVIVWRIVRYLNSLAFRLKRFEHLKTGSADLFSAKGLINHTNSYFFKI
ncbi:hypothetical protein SUGI_0343120 [Cryptomeria japonica]|nr:hypothetical protein SUGI_0343120 [Cryptomeria japonica]